MKTMISKIPCYLKIYFFCPYGIVFSSAPYSELPEQKLKFFPLYYSYSVAEKDILHE